MDPNSIDYILDLISKEETHYRQFVTAFRRYNISDQIIEEYLQGRRNIIQALKNIVELVS